MSPSIAYNFGEELIDGKRVVYLEIPAAESVVTEFDHERYIRIGSIKELLRRFPKIESKLWIILGGEEFSLAKEESLNQNPTFRVFKIYLDEYGVSYTDSNLFSNNHMLTKDGKYNYLAYMFSDQFDMSFKVVKYSGENKRSEFLLRKEFGGGCILKSIDNLLDYMEGTENLVRSYFDGRASRRDEFLFDKKSFREAYINACLHNDWSTKTGPAVFIFSDHLEIFSYGSPLLVQSKHQFLQGNSKPINAELARVFMKFEKYEESGRGASTILSHYDPSVFKFDDEDNLFFTVSFP